MTPIDKYLILHARKQKSEFELFEFVVLALGEGTLTNDQANNILNETEDKTVFAEHPQHKAHLGDILHTYYNTKYELQQLVRSNELFK